MQCLAKKGFISSYQGVHGGYILSKDPNAVSISSLIEAIEGKTSIKIVQCEATKPADCMNQILSPC